MNDARIVGIGCFAKPDTLSKIFKKAVKSYFLEFFESCDSEEGHFITRNDGMQLLQRLLSQLRHTAQPAGRRENSDLNGKQITGFFMGLEDRVLNLMVFARDQNEDNHVFSGRLDRWAEFSKKEGMKM